MGIFDSILGGLTGGVGSALAGGLLSALGGGSKQSGTTTQTQQQQLDPRMQAYLYGDGTAGNPGILGNAAALAGQPRSPGSAAFGSGIDNYMGGWGLDNFMRSQQSAQQLQETKNAAPQISNVGASVPALVKAAQINAPAQNSLNLAGSYDKFINGDAGANPYLTKALQAGVDMTNTSYQKNQADLTNTLQRNVLPGIRSNSVLAGQYGGSRQGIAEGNALSDYTKQLTNANLALGQANSANTTGAQAQAYNAGQDRSLSALSGLSGQQYQTAAQQAALQQQAISQEAANVQQAGQKNVDLQQQTNLANQNAQLQTNNQNAANQATGIGLSSGLLGQAYGYGTANDAYDRTKTGQVAGILAPFTGLGSSQTNSQPYYTNPVGNAIGGATAGLGLYNAYKNASGGGGNFLNNNACLNMYPNDLYSIFGS